LVVLGDKLRNFHSHTVVGHRGVFYQKEPSQGADIPPAIKKPENQTLLRKSNLPRNICPGLVI